MSPYGIYGLVAGRLLVHPRPLPDELLTHWFYRLAWANHLRAQTLADYLFGQGSTFWGRDHDKFASPQVIERLSEVTGRDIQDIHALTLADYEGRLSLAHNPKGHSRWILPLGVYHRSRRRYGLQYCPLCLAGDEEPYFRRKWRLALSVVCPEHQVALLDRCGTCASPVIFHRNDIGQGKSSVKGSVLSCYRCGAMLSEVPPKNPPLSDHSTLSMLSGLGSALDRGWWQGRQGLINYSHQLFDVLHYLANRLNSPLGATLLAEVERRIGKQYLSGSPKLPGDFELLPIERRQWLLSLAVWLVQEWPSRFVDVCTATHTWRSKLFRDFDAPWWYAKVIVESLDRTPSKVSADEANMAARHVVGKGLKAPLAYTKRALGGQYCAAVRESQPRAPPKLVWPKTGADFELLLQRIASKQAEVMSVRARALLARDRVILLLMRDLGLRPQEALGMSLSDVDGVTPGTQSAELSEALLSYLSLVRPKLASGIGSKVLFPGRKEGVPMGYPALVGRYQYWLG